LAASKSNTIDSLVKHNNVELAELNNNTRQTAKTKGPERGLFWGETVKRRFLQAHSDRPGIEAVERQIRYYRATTRSDSGE